MHTLFVTHLVFAWDAEHKSADYGIKIIKVITILVSVLSLIICVPAIIKAGKVIGSVSEKE